jgi:hypothetical protein
MPAAPHNVDCQSVEKRVRIWAHRPTGGVGENGRPAKIDAGMK